MNKKLTRLEKAIILHSAYSRKKLITYTAGLSKQPSLFGGYSSVNIDTVFDYFINENMIKNEAIDKAKNIITKHYNNDVTIIDYFDERYPIKLRVVDDAPFLLFIKGDSSILNKKGLAVVGTRNPSKYGRKASYDYSCYFAKKGYSIISGLANGIDTAAHLGALDAKGTTIAILAAGLDTIYPHENVNLAERIINSGGALISEHPLGFPLYRHEFVQRNRIQSAMSICSLIVESSPGSGSLTQAKWSHSQGKKIYTIQPDSIADDPDFFLAGGDLIESEYDGKRIKYSEGFSAIEKYLTESL